jgi:transcriptional regulator with XRE-family HTH domain
MSPSDRNPAVTRIRLAMIEKKLTQAELADVADCHEKTVQNLMNGRSVRDQTLFDVCMVLGLDFDEIKLAWTGPPPARPAAPASSGSKDMPGKPGAAADVAPLYMGAYSRDAVDQYVGQYLTVRPAFTLADTIVAYRTDISWDADWPSLLFEERNRPDVPFSHRGRLYVPASSMFIHLVSLTKGAMRNIVVSQLDQSGQMRGLITTLNKAGAQFMPVSAPIVYAKRADVTPGDCGEISKAHPAYAGYRSLIDEALGQGYAKLVR